MFRILDHVRAKEVSDQVEKFTESLASDLTSSRIQLHSSEVADKQHATSQLL
jgi:hypothetical protein